MILLYEEVLDKYEIVLADIDPVLIGLAESLPSGEIFIKFSASRDPDGILSTRGKNQVGEYLEQICELLPKKNVLFSMTVKRGANEELIQIYRGIGPLERASSYMD